MRYGTGVKNKVLAALAMKIPVVATPQSLFGLRAVGGEHVLVAERPEDFAAQIGALLADPCRAETLVENGRTLIERHYSWKTYADALEQALVGVAGRWNNAEISPLLLGEGQRARAFAAR